MIKTVRILLCVVMAAAIAVGFSLASAVFRDQRLLRDLSGQLSASRTAWETTAAEKEKLQAELRIVEDALKEARLTLQESTERAETLQAEIDTLEAEISGMPPVGKAADEQEK